MATAALRAASWAATRLTPVTASNAGARIARLLGPLLPAHRVGDANLRRAMPELDAPARAQILQAVWDNLGRTAAELLHLPALRETPSGPGWELTGEQHLLGLGQAIFFSGHLGNWEMVLPIAAQRGLPVSGFYRAASNPGVDATIQALRQRALGPNVSMFAKGAGGARAALKHLAQGGSLGLLVDQKMNDGIPIPFFGLPAMTAPAAAEFARRFRLPLIPVHVIRTGPARFRMVVEPPLAIPLTNNRKTDIATLTTAMNETLERWIRAEPGAWLWLHRRWPKPPKPGTPPP